VLEPAALTVAHDRTAGALADHDTDTGATGALLRAYPHGHAEVVGTRARPCAGHRFDVPSTAEPRLTREHAATRRHTGRIRRTARRGPCGDGRRGSRGRRGCACAAGSRASWPGDGCSAGTYACSRGAPGTGTRVWRTGLTASQRRTGRAGHEPVRCRFVKTVTGGLHQGQTGPGAGRAEHRQGAVVRVQVRVSVRVQVRCGVGPVAGRYRDPPSRLVPTGRAVVGTAQRRPLRQLRATRRRPVTWTHAREARFGTVLRARDGGPAVDWPWTECGRPSTRPDHRC
jgi:hypothetical protein